MEEFFGFLFELLGGVLEFVANVALSCLSDCLYWIDVGDWFTSRKKKDEKDER